MKTNSARVENLIPLIIVMVDRLAHDKKLLDSLFWQNILQISKKYANYQIPLKFSFDAPFY